MHTRDKIRHFFRIIINALILLLVGICAPLVINACFTLFDLCSEKIPYIPYLYICTLYLSTLLHLWNYRCCIYLIKLMPDPDVYEMIHRYTIVWAVFYFIITFFFFDTFIAYKKKEYVLVYHILKILVNFPFYFVYAKLLKIFANENFIISGQYVIDNNLFANDHTIIVRNRIQNVRIGENIESVQISISEENAP